MINGTADRGIEISDADKGGGVSANGGGNRVIGVNIGLAGSGAFKIAGGIADAYPGFGTATNGCGKTALLGGDVLLHGSGNGSTHVADIDAGFGIIADGGGNGVPDNRFSGCYILLTFAPV